MGAFKFKVAARESLASASSIRSITFKRLSQVISLPIHKYLVSIIKCQKVDRFLNPVIHYSNCGYRLIFKKVQCQLRVKVSIFFEIKKIQEQRKDFLEIGKSGITVITTKKCRQRQRVSAENPFALKFLKVSSLIVFNSVKKRPKQECSLTPAPPTELIVKGVKGELVWVNECPRV